MAFYYFQKIRKFLLKIQFSGFVLLPFHCKVGLQSCLLILLIFVFQCRVLKPLLHKKGKLVTKTSLTQKHHQIGLISILEGLRSFIDVIINSLTVVVCLIWLISLQNT